MRKFFKGKRLRITMWLLFGVFVAGWVVVSASALPPVVRFVVSDWLVYMGPLALSAIGGVIVLACVRMSGSERFFWGCITVAMTSVFISELRWEIVSALTYAKGQSAPGALQIFHLIGALAYLAAVVSMTTDDDEPIWTRLLVYLEALSLAVTIYPFVYWFGTRRLFQGPGEHGFELAATSAFYPVTALVLLSITALLIGGWKAYRWHSWERLIVASLGVYGAGLIFMPVWYKMLLSMTGPPVVDAYTVVLGLGYYFMVMATVYRATGGQRITIAEPWPVPRSRRKASPAWRVFGLALMVPMVAWFAFGVSDRPGGAPVAGSVLVLSALLAARSVVSGLECSANRRRSVTDRATGAYTYREMRSRLAEEISAARQARTSFTIAMFEIDDFGRINDVYGHDAGDLVLSQVAQRIGDQPEVRRRVFRVGGDEFVAIMRDCDIPESMAIARRTWLVLRRAVRAGGVAPISLSVGVAGYPRDGMDVASLVAAVNGARHIARAAEQEPIAAYDANAAAMVDPDRRFAAARLRSHRETVRALAAVVDARDPDTKDHSHRVSELAVAFARFLGRPEGEVDVIGLAALMHDVGKIGIADAVLQKPGPLDEEEWLHVREHPLLGERILAPTRLDPILPIVRSHHEWWDGSGYPDGLVGDETPYLARVLSICDAYEAMTADRAYRAAAPKSHALDEIAESAGTQFDPALATAFCAMVASLGVAADGVHQVTVEPIADLEMA